MKVVFYITVVCLPTPTKRMCTPYIRAEFFLVLAQTIYSNYTYWSRAALGTPCWCGDRPRTSRCRGPPSSCLQPGKKHILFYWSRLRRTVNIFQWINALKEVFFFYIRFILDPYSEYGSRIGSWEKTTDTRYLGLISTPCSQQVNTNSVPASRSTVPGSFLGP